MQSSSTKRILEAPQTEVSFRDRQNYTVQDEQEVDYYYLTKDTWLITKIFSLHYFIILKKYWNTISFDNLIRYRPAYRKMVQSEYMWYQYLLKGEQFSVFKEIFQAEKGPFIFVFIFSIIIGVITLFGAYYQRFLFRQHQDHDFHTSGWAFFGIIIGAALIRFVIFNYIQTLANEVAINVKIHLQNSYVRVLMKLPKNAQTQQKGLLYFNYFASIQVIYLALKLMPYFISSIVIVFGIIGFIVDIVGSLGFILLGFTGGAFIIQILLLCYMFKLHEHYAQVSDKRNSLSIFGSSFLMRLIYSGLSLSFLKRILKYRSQETNIDRKYTIADGMIQVLAESAAFLTVFIFFVVEEHTGEPSYKEIFQCVVLFSVFKTPVKMMAYGLAFTMQYIGSTHTLQEMFHLCKWNQQIPKTKTFPRLYSHPNKLWDQEQFCKIQRRQGAQLVIQKNHMLSKYEGQLIMIVGKIDSHPTCEQYLTQIQESFPPQLKYAMIQYETFILDTSIKENILMGEEYDQEKFNKVLEAVHLRERIETLTKKQDTKMDQNYFKALFLGMSFKIQLARALYNQIDVLMINRQVFRQYNQILSNIKQYRKARGQTTVVINLSGSHYKLADKIIVLSKNDPPQIGTYSQLIKTSTVLNDFETQFHNHQKDLLTIKRKPLEGMQPVQFEYFQQVDTSYKNVFKFYNYNHFGAGVVLLILLFIPPLIDLYMEVIVAESKDFFDHQDTSSHSAISQEEQKITMRYGISLLIFIVSSVIKIVMLSVYLRNSAFEIVKDLMTKFMNTKIEKTLSMANKKNALDLQRNIESMDIRTTTQLDIGLTIVFELIAIMVFASISSLFFLAVGIPFSIVAAIIFVTMISYSRRIFNFRRKSRGRINALIKKIISHRAQIEAYSKNDEMFRKFTQLNHQQVTFELNEDWLLQSLSIILEFVVILMLAVVLAISISFFQQLEEQNEAFLQLSISFLIGLVNGSRLDLKLFKSIDRQVIGISSLFKMIDHHDTHKMHIIKDFPDEKVEYIKFTDFKVNFRDDILVGLNLTIQNGERVVVTGSRSGGKRVAFYSLFRMFQQQHLQGSLKINECQIYEQKISRQSLEKLVHVVQNRPLTVFGSTIKSNIMNVMPQVTEQEVTDTLKLIWKVLETDPIFDQNAIISELSTAYLDIVSFLLAIMVKPQILIIQGGFTHTDAINREKITKWLIYQSGINIIVDLTNRIEVIDLYPRHLHFEEGDMIKDVRKVPQNSK